MENYPTIQRRDGTLFFVCPEFDKGAIATTIERLIDLLDAQEDDPDLEPNGDENDTGMPEGWRASRNGTWDSESVFVLEDDEDSADDEDGADEEWTIGWQENGSQTYLLGGNRSDDDGEYSLGWTGALNQDSPFRLGGDTDREDDGDDLEPSIGTCVYVNGVMECDVEADAADTEPSLGWTEKIDQSLPHVHASCGITDGEPYLGWTGNGIGWRDGEGLDEHEDGREDDGSSGGNFTGAGNQIGKDLIRGLPIAAKRAAVYAALGARP